MLISKTPLLKGNWLENLNFLTNTRIDITYSVQHLSQFIQDPRKLYPKAVFHPLQYLKGDPTLGIFMSKQSKLMSKYIVIQIGPPVQTQGNQLLITLSY